MFLTNQNAERGLITVFDAILTGGQSGEKLQCLYGNPMLILGRRLYSPSMKDIALLEVAELFFFIFHTLVCSFFLPRTASRRLSTQQNLQANVWKIRKSNQTSSSQTASSKLDECNLLPSILTLLFRNCVNFNFGRSYLLSDFHTNTVISDRFAYPSRLHQKP